MPCNVGDRVGAILSATKDTVRLLGFGVYDGLHGPPFDLYGSKIPGWTNPRITLDNGDVVWGCECWWGPEEDIKRRIEGCNIINVRINPETWEVTEV